MLYIKKLYSIMEVPYSFSLSTLLKVNYQLYDFSMNH